MVDNPQSSAANRQETLSHLDASGSVQMVDVSVKGVTRREAIATGQVRMSAATLAAIEAGNTPKGDVIATAKLAGIMAAKQTSQLIPLCHPLPLQQVRVELTPAPQLPGYQIQATAIATAHTGVEMEALTAVSVAALTLYDMAKALDKAMSIEAICLQRKTGGRSGDYQRAADHPE
ncbi:MAG: cyclic pyranopterin monophosphate synthase MoaC [Spirulinaceae cyanobacterium SM2_1_0]|nr:cyclic pyranopterin monophosphate synthase MoaC [Spirulinaceae cyanobacterium SM2_1_0]